MWLEEWKLGGGEGGVGWRGFISGVSGGEWVEGSGWGGVGGEGVKREHVQIPTSVLLLSSQKGSVGLGDKRLPLHAQGRGFESKVVSPARLRRGLDFKTSKSGTMATTTATAQTDHRPQVRLLTATQTKMIFNIYTSKFKNRSLKNLGIPFSKNWIFLS